MKKKKIYKLLEVVLRDGEADGKTKKALRKLKKIINSIEIKECNYYEEMCQNILRLPKFKSVIPDYLPNNTNTCFNNISEMTSDIRHIEDVIELEVINLHKKYGKVFIDQINLRQAYEVNPDDSIDMIQNYVKIKNTKLIQDGE